jgi:O-antigen/teichoic acid export membrane protein
MSPIDPFPTPQSESETSDYVEHVNPFEGQRLIKQGLLHYSGHISKILSSIILVPLMLHRLGTEAYGLWIVALAVPGISAGIDNTLYLSIARETGLLGSSGRIVDRSLSTFLTACCGAYVVFGVVGGLLLVLCESSVTWALHLSPSVQDAAPATFLAVAIGFAAGRAVVFGTAVLSGLQRFGTINSISISALILRFAGFAILLELHRSLKAIASWYAVVSIVECLLTMAIVQRLGALVGDRSFIRWRLLGRSGDFAFSSFLTSILQNLYWLSPPVLLGMLSGGTSSTISLYAGQRPCFIISDLTWRGAEVVFSAAAGQSGDSKPPLHGQLVIFGTKCLLAIAMPLCIGLLILAPEVVQIWFGGARPEIAAVMRLTSIGVIADALGTGPLHVLWGQGHARRVLFITAGLTASILVLNVVLIPRFGTSGSAIAFAVSSWAGAIITSVVAVREIDTSPIDFLIESFSEVIVPSIALAVLVLVLSRAFPLHPRLLVVVAATAGGTMYAFVYWILLRIRGSSTDSIQFWFKRIAKK